MEKVLQLEKFQREDCVYHHTFSCFGFFFYLFLLLTYSVLRFARLLKIS